MKAIVINRTRKIIFNTGWIFVLVLNFQFSVLKAQYQKVSSIVQNPINDYNANVSKLNLTTCFGLAIPNLKAAPFLTNIKNLEKKHKIASDIEILKAEKTISKLKSKNEQKLNSDLGGEAAFTASVGLNFKANLFNGGAPPDNSIAIAKNGSIVSVINCNVAYFNSNGNQLWTGSFWELFNDPTLTEIIYDPVVLYDSQSDRFIMIAVHGFSSTTSKLIVSFSKTNNPLDGWWIYKLTGNPLNNSCWLDYPKLGISNDEIFITGNLFSDNSGFSQSVIYQIGKNNGFSGTNLNWILWSNITGSPVYLIPVTHGQQGNYGPGLYFLNQSPGRGNSVNLYEITNKIGSNPQIIRNQIFKSDYEPSGNALQLGTSVNLITADCKILNAFYLNDIIHYVFQSDYNNSNYSGINYNQLNLKTLTNLSYTYGEIGFDCAYPSVASFSTTSTDKSVVFCYLRSGVSIYPEIRVVKFDNNQNWSNSTLVKSGVNFVDAFQFDNSTRWGDYTGITNRFNNSNPEVWVSGCYGSNQRLFNTNYNCFNNWIAQITDVTIGNYENVINNQHSINLFPNPVIDLFSIEFEILPSELITKVEIFDLSGKLVKVLFAGKLKAGKNLLTFNRNAISTGTYFITIKTENRILTSKKIIVD